MSNEQIQKDKNDHLDNLLKKIVDDFNGRVKIEKEISNVLLKGHLLVENLLQETLASLDLKGGINRISFYEKVKRLYEFKTNEPIMQSNIKDISPVLFALNETRNNLAHNLDFQVSESDVNRIGLNIGSEFVLQKYKTGYSNTRENLLFCLKYIVHKVGLIMFLRIEELKDKTKKVEKK